MRIKKEVVWKTPGDYFQECHASTCIRDDAGNLIVAYFAGSKEGDPDVGIWISRRIDGVWEEPVRIQYEYGLPHWNPVLHRDGDRILLYYKVGPSPREWLTLVSESYDFGGHWTKGTAVRPAALQIATKNRILKASDGRWLAGSSVETLDYLWNCSIEISDDCGKTWTVHPIPFTHGQNRPEGTAEADGVIQPALWQSEEQTFHCLMRSTGGYVYRSDSMDGGESWCEAYPVSLPNNNSGISLAQLSDGKLLLAYNPVSDNWGARTPLSLAVSEDNGVNWEKVCDLETELIYLDGKRAEFSYPYLIEHGHGVDLVYTWNRKNIVYCGISELF